MIFTNFIKFQNILNVHYSFRKIPNMIKDFGRSTLTLRSQRKYDNHYSENKCEIKTADFNNNR